MPRALRLSGWLLAVTLVTSGISLKETLGQSSGGHRWGVLIGIDDYANAEDLQFSGADQRALRQQLIAAGFPQNQVFLLQDKAAESKYLPNKGNIEQQLQLVLGLAEKDDIIVVSFSGHGLQLGTKAYFCPTEAQLDDPESLVPLDWVYQQLASCPAAFKLIVVDACRNDPQVRGRRSLSDPAKNFLSALAEPPPEGIVQLTSCSPGEVSMEDQEFGHGVFMHFLLQGLSGKADKDSNGKISLAELNSYAGQETKVYVARKFSESQRPYLKGDLAAEALDFDLADVLATTKLAIPFPIHARFVNARPLRELNSSTGLNRFPWMAPDGLTIWWTREATGTTAIYQASRSNPAKPFSDVRKVLDAARMATLSPDGLTLICLRNPPASNSSNGYRPAELCVSRRTSWEDSFSIPVGVTELASIENPKGSAFSPDGLSLFILSSPAAGSNVLRTTRANSSASWNVPNQLTIEGDLPPGYRITLPSLDAPGDHLLFGYTNPSTPAVEWPAVADRTTSPLRYVDARPILVDGKQLNTRGARYCAATGEFFFAREVGGVPPNYQFELWVANINPN